MTPKTKKILLVAVGGLYLIATRVQRAVRNLAWRFVGVNVVSSDNATNSCKVQLRLQLRNSTAISLRLRAIVCDVYIQGVKVAKICDAYNQVIAAKSISTVDIFADLSWTGVANAIQTNIASGDIRNVNFQFKGYIDVDKVKLKINQTVTYDDLAS